MPLSTEVPRGPPPGWFSSSFHSFSPYTQPDPSCPHLPIQDTASRFLHRLGHTMVEGPDATLWMFGGLGLPQGLLGNLYR